MSLDRRVLPFDELQFETQSGATHYDVERFMGLAQARQRELLASRSVRFFAHGRAVDDLSAWRALRDALLERRRP